MFRIEILAILMLCFHSFQIGLAVSSNSLGTWNTWGGWKKTIGASHRSRLHSYLGKRADATSVRGGASCDDHVEGGKHEEVDHAKSPPPDVYGEPDQQESPRMPSLVRKTHRCTQDIILDLLKRASLDGRKDSIELRELISTRSYGYLEELILAVDANDKKLPHPRKLLHFLAPKVPAIKHSPDVNLRIHSARSDIDASIAACIIGALAHVSEAYDKQMMRANSKEGTHSVAPDLTTDRRFEQLVECVLNGVNIQKRKKQSLTRQLDKSSDEVADIEQVLDEEDVHIDDGLDVRDACRAAWGISVLGCSHLESFGDVKVLDLLLALSLRIRELLLARLQQIRQNDLFSDPSSGHITTSERLNEVVEELAEDAATAMWAFACVKACTGLRSVPLFETCCSILCQDPIDMRKRAQSAQYEPGAPIGVHDVVDRLAEAETVDQVNENDDYASKNKTASVLPMEIGIGKDALLDWLSPTEVNDVLWAIALHGSNNTSASDEITLSETASTLREIAFDRLLEWLEYDIELSQNDSYGKATAYQKTGSDRDEKTVEVVDAAALLSSGIESYSLPKLKEEMIPIENITLPSKQDAQEMEFVDSASLLASAGDSTNGIIETDTAIASSNSMVAKSEENRIGSRSIDKSRSSGCHDTLIFTLHDLAIMAWSVTELRDPLQARIVGKIVNLVEQLGLDGTKRLSGGDLANLAWAVSKFSEKYIVTEPNGTISALDNILSWICHNALQRVMKGRSLDSKTTIRILESFQPPELGRLAWAIANTLSAHSMHSQHLKRNTEVMEFARLSLEASASNSELFATEDLLRIAWAFLELCGDNDSWITESVADALGSILVSVEQSLHQWERGKMSTTQYEVKDASVFPSFFGKSRLKHQLFELELNDGDDDDENVLAPLLEKSKKPLLRDLTVDPATLCKAACGYQRLSRKYPNMKGAWTLTRVAIRLLVSKNARLMKECSIHDVIRLCEATVLAQVDGHGTDLVTGLFARKVVQVLNAALDNDLESMYSSIDVSQASAVEICNLIWSLGEFGVKHYFHEDGKRSAYKRMRFVCESALLSASEIDNLDNPTLLRLLRGSVLMNYLASDKVFLLNILKGTEKKCLELNCHDLCCVAESIAVLKDGLSPGHHGGIDTAKCLLKPRESSLDTSQTEEEDKTHKKQSGDAVEETEFIEEEESSLHTPTTSVENELQKSCEAILTSVGVAARKNAAKLSLKEIRRLLLVFSLLPFQDDDLVESLSSVVALRKKHLDLLPCESMGTLLRTARSSAESVKDTALGHIETQSVFDQLKHGFVSFFSSMKEREANDMDDHILTEKLLTSVQDSIDRASTASKCAEDLQGALGVSLDLIFSKMKRGAAFELAQCKELVENYHRINFATGTFRSRYDKTRARDIAKRVLGRLLP